LFELNVDQCWNNKTELVRAVIGSDACVRRRQLVKGIGCTFLKLPEILLFNFETHIVSIDIWIFGYQPQGSYFFI